MKRIAALAVVLASVCPAVAEADAPVAWQRKALTEAQRVWHPACGPMRIVFADPATANTTRDDGEPVTTAAGWNDPERCEIIISTTATWLGYPEFCTVVLHEGGHVAGRPHSTRGIMRAEPLVTRTDATINGRLLTRWAGVDRRCLPTRLHVGNDQIARRVRKRARDRG